MEKRVSSWLFVVLAILVTAAVGNVEYIKYYPFGQAVSLGMIPNVDNIIKFGYNDDVDSIGYETVWSVGGPYPWASLASPQTVEVVSTSANDNPASTGAHTVSIRALDANFDKLDFGDPLFTQPNITMNGLTPVVLGTPISRVYRMDVDTAGATGENEGIIRLQISPGGVVLAEIPIGRNQTSMAVYTIPRNHEGCIKVISSAVGRKNTGDAEIRPYIRPFGGVFQQKYVHALNTVSKATVTSKFTGCIPEDEMSDIDIRAFSQVNDMDTYGRFELFVYKKKT